MKLELGIGIDVARKSLGFNVSVKFYLAWDFAGSNPSGPTLLTFPCGSYPIMNPFATFITTANENDSYTLNFVDGSWYFQPTSGGNLDAWAEIANSMPPLGTWAAFTNIVDLVDISSILAVDDPFSVTFSWDDENITFTGADSVDVMSYSEGIGGVNSLNNAFTVVVAPHYATVNIHECRISINGNWYTPATYTNGVWSANGPDIGIFDNFQIDDE